MKAPEFTLQDKDGKEVFVVQFCRKESERERKHINSSYLSSSGSENNCRASY